MSFFISISD